jgi:hypothetical protein
VPERFKLRMVFLATIITGLRTRVEGSWKQVKGKVKEKWGNLTDEDLTAINGQRDQGKRNATASPRIRSERTLTTGTNPQTW